MDSLKLELVSGWKFHYGENENAWYKGYDDQTWSQVIIPHDWSVEGEFE